MKKTRDARSFESHNVDTFKITVILLICWNKLRRFFIRKMPNN